VNFLNVGPWELAVILIIAILLVGPKRMAEMARTIGRVTSQMRTLSDEFIGVIQAELQETENETHQALDSIGQDVPGPATGILTELEATERETRQVLENIEDELESATG
jgi:sec-independent protein translocase protein TatB